jgi:hypothetical protein
VPVPVAPAFRDPASRGYPRLGEANELLAPDPDGA